MTTQGDLRPLLTFTLLAGVLVAPEARAQASGGAPSVPLTAPFERPSPNRVLPPPAPLADLAMPDPDGSSAVEEDLQKYQADEIVTTAKRSQRLADVPMTVSWIPAEELEGTGQFTLCDSMQFFPGMECRRGPMRKAVVSANGLGSNFLSNRVLLLKDGRPLTDPWTGVFYPDETTPLTNIKQIEVVRGPGSSLYGSNAFSGVINLIQRTPDDVIAEGRSVGLDARALAGQNETLRLQATGAGKAGPLKGLLNVYRFTSAGPQLLNDPATGVIDTQEWSEVNQGTAKVEIGPVTLDADYSVANIGRPGGRQITSVGNCGRCHYTPNDAEHVENFNGAAHADIKVNDNLRVFGEAYALFKRRVVDLENEVTGELGRTLGKRRRFGGEARALITVGGLNLTVGGDAKRDQVNNQNITVGLNQGDLQETIIGGFADAEFRPVEPLSLGAGVRYDYYRIPEEVWRAQSSQISPRASVMYRPLSELSMRINYGRAFRAPTFAELAINQQMYASTLLGNPDLRAETLDTLEASVDFWPLGGAARMTVTGFYKKASNFINQVYSGGSTSVYQNVGDARIIGGEADVAAQVKRINSSFDVSYQLLNARSLPSGGSGRGEPLDYAAQHRVSLRGHTNVSKSLFIDVYGLFVSSRQDPAFQVNAAGLEDGHVILPGYFVASARVGVNIIDGLSASLIGTNIFNSPYEETHGFPQPGLQLFGELKYVY